MNLSGSDFRNAEIIAGSFSGADLSFADLRGAELNGADFSKVDLSNANLKGVKFGLVAFSEAKFNGVDLSKADLTGVEFVGTDLSGVNLSLTKMSEVNLSEANLSSANLHKSDLRGANLVGTDLRGANLTEANLDGARMQGANLSKCVLTGACIKDWNVSRATNLEDIAVDHVYFGCFPNSGKGAFNFLDRRPHSGSFGCGEFAILFQKTFDTIDLIFMDGIDWQGFFQSFQELRTQYVNQEISIQAIEKKSGSAFVVRLEVPLKANKAAIESSAKKLYETDRALLEERYRTELRAKDSELIAAYKQRGTDLVKITELISKSMTSEINQTFNAPVGSASGHNYGSMSAIQNNDVSSREEITRLISLLHSQIQTFPSEHKDETLDVLSVLEIEVEKTEPDLSRISRWLKKLLVAGSRAVMVAGGAAAFSGHLTEFTSNVSELANTLGISIEQIQPSETPEP